MTEETKEVQVKNVNADLEKAKLDLEKTKLELKMEMIKLRAGYAKAFNLFEQQVKAPAKNGHVDFTSKKGRTKYDYVTIDDLIKSINDGIKGTGLSWQQEAKVDTQGQSSIINIRTIVRHENGYEYVSPSINFVSSNAPQSIGSAITYAKRYSLSATFGINSEADDDAQEAQNYQPHQQANRPQQSSRTRQNNYNANRQISNNQQQAPDSAPAQSSEKISSEQRETAEALIKTIAESKNQSLESVRNMFLKMFNASVYIDLSYTKANQLIEILTKQLEKINGRGDTNVK